LKTLQFFPGCSLEGFNGSYYTSAIALGKLIGYELDEIEDWNCCGATAYSSVSEERTLLANARNLAIAEKKSEQLTVVCGACYAALSKATRYYSQSPSVAYLMNSALRDAGMVYKGKVKVRHLLEVVFNDYSEEELAAKVTRPLKGIKIAPYYGCMIFRPVSAEIPRDALERLIHLAGADAIDFSGKDKCCGGMIVNSRPDVGLVLVKNLLAEAQMKGAQLFITTCPLCQINLELYQGAINKRFGTNFKIPAIYFTQMLGYAMGGSPKDLGLGTEVVNSLPVLEKVEVSRTRR
jgi:heterodisulfide reductase subunit B2